MTDGLGGLTDEQRQAVRAPGHVIIVSTAGAGKTTVLKHRAAYLMAQNKRATVCAVSYTKKAAAELKERLAMAVGPDATERLVTGTFHSIAKRMLEQSGRQLSLADEARSLELIRIAVGECIDHYPGLQVDACIDFINETKRSLDPLLPSPAVDPRVAVYLRYQALLARYGSMDFADLIIEAVRGLMDGSLPALGCTYMLCDEWQDADSLQLEFVMHHVRAGTKVTVVGDDDQAIYGFRGSMGGRALLEFQQRAGAAVLSLTTSFRCPPQIFMPAARLITRNSERMPGKQLASGLQEVGKVSVVRVADRKDEAVQIFCKICESGEPNDWGVLARTNAQLDPLTDLLGSNQVPHERADRESFWDLPTPSLVLSLCSSLANDDLMGVDAVLRSCGVEPARINAMHEHGCRHGGGTLRRWADAKVKRGPKSDAFSTMHELIQDWLRSKPAVVLPAIGTFLEQRLTMTEGRLLSKEQRLREIALIKRAIDQLKNLARLPSRQGGGTPRTGDGPAGETSLKYRVTRARMKSDEPTKERGVRLMSLHSSKGLEFRNVWIIGVEDGSMPSLRSNDIEEERRLAFVGMTRATTTLYLSHTIGGTRSPFLGEAGL